MSTHMTYQPSILVVDDESHIQHVVSLKLRNAGYLVETAADGEEALHAIAARIPDLIVTDLQMPYLDGIGLCRALLDSPDTNEVPVIVLTARGYALGEEAVELPNVSAVLSKPFSPRAILDVVSDICQIREKAA
ncbi:MAG: response regulator [Phycisphaerales bacterium]|nr:response regulator [Phycisphaerales bacterium]